MAGKMTTILITGANRGLGLEFTRQYAADGARLIAACRAPSPELQALAKDHANLQIEALDVADIGSIDALGQRLAGTGIDLLINNAGIYGPRAQSLDQIDAAAWGEVFAVNAIAPLKVIQALRANLMLTPAPKVITITSRMGSIAETSGGNYIYRSSKSAVNMVMRSLALDLKSTGLAVGVMHPGWVKTDMGGPSATLSPAQSVASMKAVIAKFDLSQTGAYFNYDGSIIPW